MDHELVSQKELAELVGYSVRQISRLLNHPECPGVENDLYDVEEWTEFLAVHGRKSPATTRKAELEAQKLEIHNRRQLWKHECDQKQWTRNTELAPEIQSFDQELIRLVRDSLEEIIPRRGAGKTRDELQRLGRDQVDRIMSAIQRGEAELTDKFPAPPEATPAQ